MTHVYTSIALLLIALTGGMFLLDKTKKESLSVFYKAISWVVIVFSLGSLLCMGIRCVSSCGSGGCGKKCGPPHANVMMWKGECGDEDGIRKCIKIKHCEKEMMGEGMESCEEKKCDEPCMEKCKKEMKDCKKECKEEKKACCKKDSVAVKK